MILLFHSWRQCDFSPHLPFFGCISSSMSMHIITVIIEKIGRSYIVTVVCEHQSGYLLSCVIQSNHVVGFHSFIHSNCGLKNIFLVLQIIRMHKNGALYSIWSLLFQLHGNTRNSGC